ncbi:MAG: 30S ribosome-binding factor RbfA [bacterium]
MSYRNKRVAEVIKEAVANIILQDLSDPNFDFVTVTQAKISRDLKNATVYFSIFGDKEQQNRTLAHLNRAKGLIRHLLAKHVTLRYLPELYFELDTLVLKERKVGEILDGLHQAENQDKKDEKQN